MADHSLRGWQLAAGGGDLAAEIELAAEGEYVYNLTYVPFTATPFQVYGLMNPVQ